MPAFEIVAHVRASVDNGGGQHPPETVFIGPDANDAPTDLAFIAAAIAHDRGLHIHRLSSKSAYLSDGDTFVDLYVRKEGEA